MNVYEITYTVNFGGADEAATQVVAGHSFHEAEETFCRVFEASRPNDDYDVTHIRKQVTGVWI